MKYSDLCQAFYLGPRSTGLKSKKSQKDIGEFFVSLAIGDSKDDLPLPSSDDAYAKWFSGNTCPRQEIWEAVKNLDEKGYVKSLNEELDTKRIDKVANKLGIFLQRGETVDIERLANSIVKIVIDLAEGLGETDKEITDYYEKTDSVSIFAGYIQYARERYNLMKLIGGDEVFLEDYFVCNTIGEKRKIGFDKSSSKGGYIEEATIEKIRTHYQKRGVDNRKVLLIASGGSGKTLMLQHLLLESLSRFNETGVLPVILELRDYIQSDSIIGFITKTLNKGGGSFTEEQVDRFLLEGKLHILFDGLDEVDPEDVKVFQRKFDGFDSHYSKVMIIIASRDCEAMKGIRGFVRMYVWPFDNNQSMKLIEKIIDDSHEPDAKDAIIQYIEHGFIKKNGVFASHPMMLTFVARNYPKFSNYSRNHLLFYQGAYKALLSGHDDNKKPYARIFKSVSDAEEFTKVFSEFCARSYERGEHEFDEDSFEILFDELKSTKTVKSLGMMNFKSFKQDACSTACMMYEEDDKEKYFYIDPGFQKYLFAHYYIHADADETKRLGNELLNTKRYLFEDYDAFDMLYGKVREKFERCVLFPYLQSIFQGKDDTDAMVQYLKYGFDEIHCTVIFEDVIHRIVEDEKIPYLMSLKRIDEPRTVLLDYIFNIVGNKHEVSFVTTNRNIMLEGVDNTPVYGKMMVENSEKKLFLVTSLTAQSRGFAIDSIEHCKDEHDNPVVFGKIYSLNTQIIAEQLEDYVSFIDELLTTNNVIYDGFVRVKKYYDELRRQIREKRMY